jgi:hypothetical protein
VAERTWKDRGFESETQQKVFEVLAGQTMEQLEAQAGEGLIITSLKAHKKRKKGLIKIGKGLYREKSTCQGGLKDENR